MLEMMEHLSNDRSERERLERRAEIDSLRLELAAMKRVLERTVPGFENAVEQARDELRSRFDPEFDRTLDEAS